MVTRVKKVRLVQVGTWLEEGVTLDMDTLAQYDGKGECEEVVLSTLLGFDTRERYGSQVKAWASNIGWQIKDGARAIEASRRA